eukprot:m.47686 g.47686  ORF g.47686 m.47686 type:complete len:245 (-) comp20553_c0_seq2:108-842(-)
MAVNRLVALSSRTAAFFRSNRRLLNTIQTQCGPNRIPNVSKCVLSTTAVPCPILRTITPTDPSSKVGEVVVRYARSADVPAMLLLMPRLAEISAIPPHRTEQDLYEGDAEMLSQWGIQMASVELQSTVKKEEHELSKDTAQASDLGVLVAESQGLDAVVGFAIVRIQPEFIAHQPGAHLETLAVAEAVDGMGLGRVLVTEAEAFARTHGAQSMTLHVFATNTRARSVYDRIGYDAELLRYIKHF